MKKLFRKITGSIHQHKESRRLIHSDGYRFLRAFPPGHFYSPIPDFGEINERSSSIFNKKVKDLPGIDLREPEQLVRIDSFKSYYNELPWSDEVRIETLRYRFDNIYFSYGDAITLYSMMRQFGPKRIIEVGSGFSSAAMLDVDELFFDNEIEFTFIEPYPDRLRALLSDEDLSRVTLLDQPVQQVDLSLFEKLENGDILFIDSSHVSKTDSDVNDLIHRILPHLKLGVIIHFHDILWPFEYPKKWLKAGRAWNEAYLLRAFLQYNSSFEILFFNSYLEHHHRQKLRETLPLMLRQPPAKMTFGNSSLWLRKK